MTDTNEHPPPQLVSIGEVARRFGVSVATVRNWERSGKLAAVRTPGGQRRFRPSDIAEIMDGAA
jgi:excisionase family DNA binding protein